MRNIIGAVLLLVGVVAQGSSAQSQTVTIEEFTNIVGDILAIFVICPQIKVDQGAMEAFYEASGVSKRMMTDETGYWEDVEVSKKASFKRRKVLSVNDNCEDAHRLYGEQGTVVQGLFKR